jgi:hypothetical protein
MNSLELYNNFLLEYDINGSQAAAGFSDDEIYMFLTKGQLYVMGQLESGPTADLSELIFSISTGVTNDVMTYEIPNVKVSTVSSFPDIYKFVNGTALVTRTGLLPTRGFNSYVPVKKIDEAHITNLLQTEFNKPIFEWLYFFPNSDKLFFIHDAYTTNVTMVKLVYIRMPNDITSTSNPELNAKYHKDIVTSAVKIAQITTNDIRARVQTKQE